MKKFIVTLFGLAVLLVITTSMLTIYLEPIVEYVAPKVAVRYGVQLDNLQIDRLTFNELIISSVNGKYVQEDLSANIIAQDVVINISIKSAIQSTIQNIKIDELSLQMNTHSSQSDTVNHDQTLRDIIADFPIIPFAINELNLSYAVNDEQKATMQAKVVTQKNHFTFDGQITSSFLPASQVNVEVSSQGNILLGVEELDTQAVMVNWQGSLLENNNQILLTMHGDTNFSSIQKYLAPVYSAPVDIIKDTSITKIDVQIDLDQPFANLQQALLINLYVDTQIQLEILTDDIKTVYLDAEIDCALEKMQAIDCVIDQPIHTQVLLQDSLAIMNDYFATDEKEYFIELIPLDELTIQMQTIESVEIDIAGGFQTKINAASIPLSLQVEFTENQWHYAEKLAVSLAYNAEIHLEDLMKPLAIAAADLAIQGNIEFDGQYVDMLMDKETKVALNKIKYQDIALDQLMISLRKPFATQYVVNDNEIVIQDMLLNISPSRIAMNNMMIDIGAGNLKVSDIRHADGAWSANANTTIDMLEVLQSDISLNIFNINNLTTLKDDQISFDGDFLISEDQVLLDYQGSHNISGQQGSLNTVLNKFPLIKSQLARQLIKTSGLPMQVKSGDVGLIADLVWGPQVEDNISVQADLQLRNIDGYYAQNNFTGLNADVSVNGWSRWALNKSMSLHLDEFNIGFPVTDISLDIAEINKPVEGKASIKIDEFSAQALDGSVLAKELEIDFNESVNEFTIYLFNLSLEKLLALNQTEDLIVNGVFNGELPIRLENDRISIKNGWLKVDEKGGIIKYTRIKDILSGDQNVEILAELLDNFHYQQLSAELNMQPDGETILAAKVLGSNPNIENGGDVSLNPNIEINLLKMLHNLRLLSRVAEEITNQVIENEAVN